MCGIAGVIVKDKAKVRRDGQGISDLVRQMLSRIAHRGREEADVFSEANVSIGCCRLPIVDRYNGQQPMQNEDGDVIVVFNGEIYNFSSLRESLANAGHKFVTNCDSEVIPHLFEDCRGQSSKLHDDLYGMYAIAIYDRQNQRLVLSRDHVGKKPLYLLETQDLFAFASEVKAFGTPLDAMAFGEGAVLSDVLPGETIELYEYSVAPAATKPNQPPSCGGAITSDVIAIQSVRECMKKAVECRMPADDISLAILCSGGIDSAIITWLASNAAKSRNVKITAYVIGNDMSPDIRAARMVCQALQVPLSEVIINENDLISVVSDVVYATESFEPNVVRNSLLSYLLFKRIREDGHRVALCGEGADELFLGYADFEHSTDKRLLREQLLGDLYQTQLLRVDRTSMAFNVETRAPFLDRDVVELARRLEPSLNQSRIYGVWQGKSILREAFCNDLPWETVTRSKATFSYGAGFGEVDMNHHGPIENYASRILGTELGRLKNQYPLIDLSTNERALYLYLFEQFYRVPKGYKSPVVARRETHTAGFA